MYNTKYRCTYTDEDVFLETDEVNEAERVFIRNCIYRQDLLNIFNLEEFDDQAINNEISKLYEIIKGNEIFYNCMKKAATSLDCATDNITGLMLLLSFDHLCYVHPCICEFIDTGFVSKDLLCDFS